jgi:hypothetical protein
MALGPLIIGDVVKNHDITNERPRIHQLTLIG